MQKNAKMPPQILRIAAVPTEQSILPHLQQVSWLGFILCPAFPKQRIRKIIPFISDPSASVTPAASRGEGLCLPYSSGGCSGFEPDSLLGS